MLPRLAGSVALVVSLGTASPTVIDPRVAQPLNQLAVRDPVEFAQHQVLEKRLSTEFSLDREWSNEILFGGYWVEAGDNGAEGVALQVECLECWTRGTVTAKLTTDDIVKPIVRLDFEGVEAYLNLGIKTSAGATYAINLFTSDSPLGLGLETDVFDGDITDHFFDGLSTESIPVVVHAGSATFKAALRLRVQCGAAMDHGLFGVGGGALMGIYANIVEFVAVLESTPTCELQTTEWFDLNVGAYAMLGVVVDYQTVGAVPTVSTTLLKSPTFTQCWLDISPWETSAAYTTTGSVVTGDLSASRSYLPPLVDGTSSGSAVTTASRGVASSSVGMPGSASTTCDEEEGETSTTAAFATGFWPGNSTVTTPGDGMVTSTVYATTTYTVTSCAAEVINCPASWEQEIVVTKTVDAFTTVCPSGASITFPSLSKVAHQAVTTSATGSSAESSGTVVGVVHQVIVLTTCETPEVETFVPPLSKVPPIHHVLAVDLTTSPSPDPAAGFPEAVADTMPAESWTNSTTRPMATTSPSGGWFHGAGSPTGRPVTAGAAGMEGWAGRRGLVAALGLVLLAVLGAY